MPERGGNIEETWRKGWGSRYGYMDHLETALSLLDSVSLHGLLSHWCQLVQGDCKRLASDNQRSSDPTPPSSVRCRWQKDLFLRPLSTIANLREEAFCSVFCSWWKWYVLPLGTEGDALPRKRRLWGSDNQERWPFTFVRCRSSQEAACFVATLMRKFTLKYHFVRTGFKLHFRFFECHKKLLNIFLVHKLHKKLKISSYEESTDLKVDSKQRVPFIP